MLVSSEQWGPEIRTLCTRILETTIKDTDKYQVGLTKIFFRAGLLARFEQLRTDRLNQLATLMQKNVRRHLAVKNYTALRKAVIGVQTAWRATLAKRRAEEEKREKAAVLIQSTARGFLERQKFLRVKSTIVAIQSSEFDISRSPPDLELTLALSQSLAATGCAKATSSNASSHLQCSSRASSVAGQCNFASRRRPPLTID